MRPSRGMGDIASGKQPRTVQKKDGAQPVELFKKGGAIVRPSKLGPLKKPSGAPTRKKLALAKWKC